MTLKYTMMKPMAIIVMNGMLLGTVMGVTGQQNITFAVTTGTDTAAVVAAIVMS